MSQFSSLVTSLVLLFSGLCNGAILTDISSTTARADLTSSKHCTLGETRKPEDPVDLKDSVNPLVVTFEIKPPDNDGDCFVILTPLHDTTRQSPLVIYTNQTHVRGHWYLMKSEVYKYVPLVFLNYVFPGPVNRTAIEGLRGVHQVEFANSTKVYFFASWRKNALKDRAAKIEPVSGTRYRVSSAHGSDFWLCLEAKVEGDECPVEAEDESVVVTCDYQHRGRGEVEIKFPNVTSSKRNVSLSCYLRTSNTQSNPPNQSIEIARLFVPMSKVLRTGRIMILPPNEKTHVLRIGTTSNTAETPPHSTATTGQDVDEEQSNGSTPTTTAAASVSIVGAATVMVVACIAVVLIVPKISGSKHKKKQKKNNNSRRRSHSTSSGSNGNNYATKVGPRIIAPPKPPPSSSGGVSPKASRKRLVSILSTTLSYFSSSSSCSYSDIESSSDQEGSEEMLLSASIPEWVKNHLYDLNSIQVGNKLGEGQYGHVYKAIVVHDNARWPVALKRIKKEGCTPEEVRKQQEDLLTEGSIMASIEYHDNIANLQGVAVHPVTSFGETHFDLMIEYCGRGSLQKHLEINQKSYREEYYDALILNPSSHRNIRRPKVNRLTSWGRQISNGMAYLTSHGIIHGDLATRNVLLTDELTAKISDFGLSHRLKVLPTQDSKSFKPKETGSGRSSSNSSETEPEAAAASMLPETKITNKVEADADLRHSQVPKRWMAPEAIRYHKVNKLTDVWSYGIVLWEIFSLGVSRPYRDLTVDTSDTFLNALESGVRPEKPEICPEEIYDVMLQCWRQVPEERPSFEDLSTSLGQHLDPNSLHCYESAREEVHKRYNSLKEATYCRMSRGLAGGFLPQSSGGFEGRASDALEEIERCVEDNEDYYLNQHCGVEPVMTSDTVLSF